MEIRTDMARIEKIGFGTDSDHIINLSAPVGSRNAVNNPDDVLVVQALLKYISRSMRKSGTQMHELIGIRCPEPTGAFNPATARAILAFQKYQNTIRGGLDSITIIEDGRVSPAQGSNLFGRNAYLWTIISLNMLAEYCYIIDYPDRKGTYIKHICKRFPAVRAALERDSVGTLGLDLE